MGKRVFLDYDQDALDRAYDQRVYAPNQEQVAARTAARAAEARCHIGEPERIAYGPSAAEHLDLWRTSLAGAPVVAFIHGGAWRGGGTSSAAAAAEVFLAAGANYAALNFILVE